MYVCVYILEVHIKSNQSTASKEKFSIATAGFVQNCHKPSKATCLRRIRIYMKFWELTVHNSWRDCRY